MKKGLKLSGERGTHAALKEFKQVHDRDVLNHKYLRQLLNGQKKAALNYLMFLKENSAEKSREEAALTTANNAPTQPKKKPAPPPLLLNQYYYHAQSTPMRDATSPPLISLVP